MTHVGERMKLLNCVSQDMDALAKILASAPRAVSKYLANVPDHLLGHCKMAAESGLGTRLAQGSRTSPGIAQYQHLNNCIPDIPIAYPMLADCAPRPNVHTLSHGRALYCIRAPGMTHTYVAKEPYGGLGLIV